MTSRQLRKIRREQERKAKKAEYKASRAVEAATTIAPRPPLPADINPELLDEFTPEFLAYSNSMRQRIERRVASMKQSLAPKQSSARPDPGFVSQQAPAAAECPNRAQINRANAQHSTGPRTDTGKLASSRNSLKHGLASGTLIIPGEDQAQFEALLNDLLAEHQPANTTEQMLIHEMAQSFWLAQRALRFQNECFTEAGLDEKRLALFLRYQTTHQRAFHKALNTLMRLQKDRRKLELLNSRGFVAQSNPSTEQERGFVSQNAPSLAPEPQFVWQNADPARKVQVA